MMTGSISIFYWPAGVWLLPRFISQNTREESLFFCETDRQDDDKDGGGSSLLLSPLPPSREQFGKSLSASPPPPLREGGGSRQRGDGADCGAKEADKTFPSPFSLFANLGICGTRRSIPPPRVRRVESKQIHYKNSDALQKIGGKGKAKRISQIFFFSLWPPFVLFFFV